MAWHWLKLNFWKWFRKSNSKKRARNNVANDEYSQKKSHCVKFPVKISRPIHILSILSSNCWIFENSLYGTFSMVLFFGGWKWAKPKDIHHFFLLGVTLRLGWFWNIRPRLLIGALRIGQFALKFCVYLFSGPFTGLSELFGWVFSGKWIWVRLLAMLLVF